MVSQDAIIDLIPPARGIAVNQFLKLPQEIRTHDLKAELISVALLALVETATRWDISKGANLKTYCIYRIRGALIDYIRSFGPTRRYPIKGPNAKPIKFEYFTNDEDDTKGIYVGNFDGKSRHKNTPS